MSVATCAGPKWSSIIVRWATIAYTAAFGVGTWRSVRRGHQAAPLGLRTGLGPSLDAVAGVGSALAAPWPLMVALWRVEQTWRSGHHCGRPGTWLASLAAVLLAGAAVEPITQEALVGRMPPTETALVAANLILPVLILVGALAALRVERSDP